ncbi:MAG TPA: hydrogenase maturation protease [Jatrophihabitans sp.]|jgi:hydrogenase maturation protease|uniref:hydrogenase maturation protease n=1 Tax=Jatrophihabitans sp. TaxID=1932789 RepID=UPI002DF976A5|nr:hydrogenase maturation protease [Jatrophihabitans sp.]
MTTRVTVIGIGNEFRHDDGVGPAVIAELQRLALADVTLVATDGEPTRLLDAWEGVELAVVIDAVPGAEPGRVHRLDGDAAAPGGGGTHGLGLADALRLAEVLDRAPQRLVLYAVEAADVEVGPGLSAEVGRAVPVVARAVLSELATAFS